jgi:putative nucleotidyltransferase with HDIG domain
MNIAAVVLAGGYSSRMGAFKPLLKLGKSTAVELAVNCFLNAGVSDVRVVAGFRAPELLAVLKPLQARVITNPHFERGMYTSVQVAVDTFEPEVDAFFILPVDSPLVSSVTIKKMLSAYGKGRQKIIYPAFAGRRGHPPLIWAGYKKEILGEMHPEGLRGVLSRHEAEARELEVFDEAVLLEMDTFDEYQGLLRYLGYFPLPSTEESLSLLRELQPRDEVREHCHTVAALASLLAVRLNLAGAGLDEPLITAGALLHDLARQEKDHARVGAQILRMRGYPQVAKIVASHMDIDVNETGAISEAELVYLTDKMVKGKEIVSLNDRTACKLTKFAGNWAAQDAVRRRMKHALQIKKKAEELLGWPLEEIQTEDCRSILEGYK